MGSMRAWTVAVAGSVALGGCTIAPGEVYPLDEATVKERVEAAEVPLLVFGSAGTRIDVSMEEDGQRIVWPLEYDGHELFRYVATITPEAPDKTRVAVTMEPGQGDKGAALFKTLKANVDIAKMYDDAMVEEIDSKIEQRRFSMAPIYQSMMVAAINHQQQIFGNTGAPADRGD